MDSKASLSVPMHVAEIPNFRFCKREMCRIRENKKAAPKRRLDGQVI
jgi:hypothetical protein